MAITLDPSSGIHSTLLGAFLDRGVSIIEYGSNLNGEYIITSVGLTISWRPITRGNGITNGIAEFINTDTFWIVTNRASTSSAVYRTSVGTNITLPLTYFSSTLMVSSGGNQGSPGAYDDWISTGISSTSAASYSIRSGRSHTGENSNDYSLMVVGWRSSGIPLTYTDPIEVGDSGVIFNNLYLGDDKIEIIEEDVTSATGNYVRFGDGTQICWRQVSPSDLTSITTNGDGTHWAITNRFNASSDVYRTSSGVAVSYPAAFIEDPVTFVGILGNAAGNDVWGSVTGDSSNWGFAVRCGYSQSNVSASSFNLFAMGRWK